MKKAPFILLIVFLSVSCKGKGSNLLWFLGLSGNEKPSAENHTQPTGNTQLTDHNTPPGNPDETTTQAGNLETNSANENDKLYTVAFEDSYPQAGDGDYNDLVVLVRNEITTVEGKVHSIKSKYRLVANGSEFNHILKIRLPVATGGTFRHSILNPDGSVYKPETYSIVTAGQFNQGLVLLPESRISIPGKNVNRGEKYQPGMIAQVEIDFDFPVVPSLLGKEPYDLFLNIENRNEEIHMNGYGKNYNNAEGYPAAFSVPGIWKWQYEGSSLYRGNQSGYEGFADWVSSGEKEKTDWYKHVTDASKVYPVPESDIAGYLMGSGNNKRVLMLSVGLLIMGAVIGLFLRKRLVMAAD